MDDTSGGAAKAETDMIAGRGEALVKEIIAFVVDRCHGMPACDVVHAARIAAVFFTERLAKKGYEVEAMIDAARSAASRALDLAASEEAGSMWAMREGLASDTRVH